MRHHVADCPTCHGSGKDDEAVRAASTTIALRDAKCETCRGLGIVRVNMKDIPIVRPNADGEWSGPMMLLLGWVT